MPGGHCLCGKTTFEYEGEPNWQGWCHCESCRRQTASPSTAFLGVDHGKWRWTGDEPRFYASSPGVKRWFCATCGAPVAFESTRYPTEIHFYAALLDEPSIFRPDTHYHWSERLPWDIPRDGLPVEG
jgi:hypothetical protein